MPVLEVRRHTMRSKPGQHLSQQGVALANMIGNSTGPFDLVSTSEKPRAIETAIAMGYAPTRQSAALGNLPKSILDVVAWPNDLESISKIVRRNSACERFALEQAEEWRSIAGELKENQSALIVTHGAIIELGAIGFMPNATYSTWGEAIGYCEGFRFSQVGGLETCELLRVPSHLQLIHN